MSTPPTVLIIDDEPQIRRLLQITLEGAGYRVASAATGSEGEQQAASVRPNVIILDLGLPDGDGLDVLRKLREWSTVPVVVLSVRSGEQDIVAALDAGADDYLTKPFRSGEMLARIRAAMRHDLQIEQGEVFRSGNLAVDLINRTVRKHDEQVKLTPMQYSLLVLFVKNAGRVLTHRYILEQIWGPSFAGESHYTRVYVGQLRKKLEQDPANPRLFLTESGIGYRLVVIE